MMKALDSWLSQFKLYRAIVGGVWVKMDDVWMSASPTLIAADDTLYMSVRFDISTLSFHQTYNGIQAMENWK